MIIDYETQSGVDLNRFGSFRYASDPSTRILSMAWQDDAGRFGYWVPEYQNIVLPNSLDNIPIYRKPPVFPKTCVAHNATGFESVITDRFRLADGVDWVDTMHLARQYGLPGSLERASQALGFGEKLIDGIKTVLRMNPLPGKGFQPGTRPMWLHILRYNMQDVILTKKLLDRFTFNERELSRVDKIINHRGIYIDTNFTKTLIDTYYQHERRTKEGCKDKFGIDGDDLWAVGKVKIWLKDFCGVNIGALNRAEVDQFMNDPAAYAEHAEDENIQKAVQLLEMRRQLVRIGAPKLERLLDMTTAGRLRGSMVYHAAHTGRWGGYGVNPLNLPRPPKKLDYEILCRNLTYTNVVQNAEYAKCEPSDILSGLIRPCFRAAPGRRLAIADYSMIEARMIAWLAGDESKMRLMNSGNDPYVEFGRRVGGDRQQGKIAVLGAGYGMGKHRCAVQYKIPLDKAALIIKTYRDTFPRIPEYWQLLHKAGLRVLETGHERVKNVNFRLEDDCVSVELPSGRKLWYREPAIEFEVPGWRKLYNAPMIEEPTFTYANPKGYRTSMYGGKWAENICQATCRDLLGDALIDFERSGLETVLHIYDEIVVECDERDSQGVLNTMISRMSAPVDWAPGFRPAAAGFLSEWYCKE